MRIALLVAALATSGPAIACDCIRLDPAFPNFAADLDRIATSFPVAAEGKLEADGPHAWRFRPTHEVRGPGKASYRIDLISDCSLAPQDLTALIGKPIFVLLVEGPGDQRGRYEISRCVNFLGPDLDRAIRQRISPGCEPR